jgi:hypothetical protein
VFFVSYVDGVDDAAFHRIVVVSSLLRMMFELWLMIVCVICFLGVTQYKETKQRCRGSMFRSQWRDVDCTYGENFTLATEFTRLLTVSCQLHHTHAIEVVQMCRVAVAHVP